MYDCLKSGEKKENQLVNEHTVHKFFSQLPNHKRLTIKIKYYTKNNLPMCLLPFQQLYNTIETYWFLKHLN